jgi:hypothetical protein
VLWGLAKCGYRAPTAWLGHYLHQVSRRPKLLHSTAHTPCCFVPPVQQRC